MPELKNIRIEEIRLVGPGGFSFPVFVGNEEPPQGHQRFLRLVPFIHVSGEEEKPSETKSGSVRQDLGRFLRCKSREALLHSLLKATQGCPLRARRKLYRDVAEAICARRPDKVGILLGGACSSKDSSADLLWRDVERLRLISRSPTPRVITAEERSKFWQHNIRHLDARFSIPGEKHSEVVERLWFLTDPEMLRLPLEERAKRLQARFGISPALAQKYASNTSLPDGPLAVLAYLWAQQNREDREEPRADSKSRKVGDEDKTSWECYLEYRIVPIYRLHRALEYRLRLALRRRLEKKEIDKDTLKSLAQIAALEAVANFKGLDDYLNSYWGGPRFHGGKHDRTWRALLRKRQRQRVKEEVQTELDTRSVSASDRIEDLPAPQRQEVEQPDWEDLDLTVLKPALREAIEQAKEAAQQGYYRCSKHGKSLKDWWGTDYSKYQRALHRAKKKLGPRQWALFLALLESPPSQSQ